MPPGRRSAPSGANLQPWHFVAIGRPGLKSRIREAAEAEEREFYRERAPQEWLDALAPLGTDEHKPYLETAPWLIAIFAALHAHCRTAAGSSTTTWRSRWASRPGS